MSISIYLKCYFHVTTPQMSKHNKHACILEKQRKKEGFWNTTKVSTVAHKCIINRGNAVQEVGWQTIGKGSCTMCVPNNCQLTVSQIHAS